MGWTGYCCGYVAAAICSLGRGPGNPGNPGNWPTAPSSVFCWAPPAGPPGALSGAATAGFPGFANDTPPTGPDPGAGCAWATFIGGAVGADDARAGCGRGAATGAAARAGTGVAATTAARGSSSPKISVATSSPNSSSPSPSSPGGGAGAGRGAGLAAIGGGDETGGATAGREPVIRTTGALIWALFFDAAAELRRGPTAAPSASSISSKLGPPSCVESPSGIPAAPSVATTSSFALAAGTPSIRPSRPTRLYASRSARSFSISGENPSLSTPDSDFAVNTTSSLIRKRWRSLSISLHHW